MAWTLLAIPPVAVALKVLAIEEIGLVTEAAGHPLPAEVVAGGVAIEKVLEEPVSPRTPVHPSPVHEVGRHPHPRVVMQPSLGNQLVPEAIHAGQLCASLPDVIGEILLIITGGMASFVIFLIVMNAIAEIEPHPLPEIAPSQLVDQFSALISSLVVVFQLREDGISHFRKRENSVADVGREACDRAIQMVATAAVALGIHRTELLFSRRSTAWDRTELPGCVWKLLR